MDPMGNVWLLGTSQFTWGDLKGYKGLQTFWLLEVPWELQKIVLANDVFQNFSDSRNWKSTLKPES